MPEFAYLTETGIQLLARDFLNAAKNAPVEFARVRESIRRAALTESKRQITAIYNLTQARVADHLSVNSTPTGITVKGQKRTITFASYGWKPGRKGLRGKILRKSPTTEFKGSFIAGGLAGDVPGVNRVSFFRSGEPRKMKAGRYIGKVREPLHGLHGPSIADALKDTRVSVPLRDRILGRASKELTRRLAKIRGR